MCLQIKPVFSAIVFNTIFLSFLHFFSFRSNVGTPKLNSFLILASAEKQGDEKLDGRGNFEACSSTRSTILEHVCTVKINYPGKSWNRRRGQRCFARERGGMELDGKVLTLHPVRSSGLRRRVRLSSSSSLRDSVYRVRLHAPSHDCNAISISK